MQGGTNEMPKFLIEIPHSSEHEACVRAAHALLSIGSHFITNADWGCLDDVHKTWLTVEVDSKEDARRIVPPGFRSDAVVIEVNKFTLQEIQEMLQDLSGEP